ncbi:MAG: AAA family ATPase, partial [Treponema sp.]|nr:AAA family ATPase [Treponema sp.]
MLTQIKFENFTAFEKLEIEFVKGINIFIGENGTGKTHILKALYSACDITKSKRNFAEKVNNIFFPSDKQIGRLVKRSKGSDSGSFEVKRSVKSQELSIKLTLTNHTIKPEN